MTSSPGVTLTLKEPRSRFGGKPLNYQVVCTQGGTAVLKGLRWGWWEHLSGIAAKAYNMDKTVGSPKLQFLES